MKNVTQVNVEKAVIEETNSKCCTDNVKAEAMCCTKISQIATGCHD